MRQEGTPTLPHGEAPTNDISIFPKKGENHPAIKKGPHSDFFFFFFGAQESAPGKRRPRTAGEFVREERNDRLKRAAMCARAGKQPIGLSEARGRRFSSACRQGQTSEIERKKAGRDIAIARGRAKPSPPAPAGTKKAARSRETRYARPPGSKAATVMKAKEKNHEQQLRGKAVAILVDDGLEQSETRNSRQRFRRSRSKTASFISPNKGSVKGWNEKIRTGRLKWKFH